MIETAHNSRSKWHTTSAHDQNKQSTTHDYDCNHNTSIKSHTQMSNRTNYTQTQTKLLGEKTNPQIK